MEEGVGPACYHVPLFLSSRAVTGKSCRGKVLAPGPGSFIPHGMDEGSDLDFDIGNALVMTAGGAGMAFLVLVLLTGLTAVMGLVLRWRVARATRLGVEAPELDPPREDELEMAAMIAASIVAARLGRRAPTTGGRPPTATSSASSRWVVQGRRDIMAGRTGRPARRHL